MVPLISSRISIQAQILFILNTTYIILYGGNKPHILKSRLIMELFNECANFFLCYHLLCFTPLVEIKEQYGIGFSYLAVTGLTLAVNFTWMFINNYFKWRTLKR